MKGGIRVSEIDCRHAVERRFYLPDRADDRPPDHYPDNASCRKTHASCCSGPRVGMLRNVAGDSSRAAGVVAAIRRRIAVESSGRGRWEAIDQVDGRLSGVRLGTSARTEPYLL